MKTFGATLKELMKARGISGRELAKQAGIPYKSLNDWIGTGNRFPRDPMMIKKLAEYFNVTVHFLLYGEQDPNGLIEQILERTEIHTGIYEVTIKKVKTKD